MKRVALVSLFLLTALLTSVAQVQAPDPPNGEWLLRILANRHTWLSAPLQTKFDTFFAQGQIDGIGQALVSFGLICEPADHHQSFEEEQQVIENGIRANPKRSFAQDSAMVVTMLLRENYPCKQPPSNKRP